MNSKRRPKIFRRTRIIRNGRSLHSIIRNFLKKSKVRRPSTRSSPDPGPSGVCDEVDRRPSEERVPSTKRKDSSETELASPKKKSRTSPSPRKKKCKTRGRALTERGSSNTEKPEGSSQSKEETVVHPEQELHCSQEPGQWVNAASEAAASGVSLQDSETGSGTSFRLQDGSSQSNEETVEHPEQGHDHSQETSNNGPEKWNFPPETTGSAEEEPTSTQGKSIKDLIAKYKVVEELKAGGFGQVYTGLRIEDNFPVALKLIRKRIVEYTKVRVNGRMTTLPLEVHLLNLLGAGPGSASSSVTPLLLDWYDLGPEIVLVFEKPDPCVDLLEYIVFQNPSGVEETTAKHIFQQLVQAASEMSAKGVFHRDIKSDNVLIETGTDEVKARFIDFGCGTTFTPRMVFTRPQGTPLYASPEWFRYERYTAGRTTVWQLGLVLYEMLFAKLPLVRERTIGSMRSVPIPNKVSQECRDLLKKCLEKDPRLRISLEDLRNHPWLNSE